MIPLTIPSPLATLATAKTKGFLTELGAQVKTHGGLIRNHTVRLKSYRLLYLRENQELRLQLAEERRARLELAKIIDSMRRGQEPRGDV
ncbi:hypothetical protein Tco_1037490 [Tanacetum coccineum]